MASRLEPRRLCSQLWPYDSGTARRRAGAGPGPGSFLRQPRGGAAVGARPAPLPAASRWPASSIRSARAAPLPPASRWPASTPPAHSEALGGNGCEILEACGPRSEWRPGRRAEGRPLRGRIGTGGGSGARARPARRRRAGAQLPSVELRRWRRPRGGRGKGGGTRGPWAGAGGAVSGGAGAAGQGPLRGVRPGPPAAGVSWGPGYGVDDLRGSRAGRRPVTPQRQCRRRAMLFPRSSWSRCWCVEEVILFQVTV